MALEENYPKTAPRENETKKPGEITVPQQKVVQVKLSHKQKKTARTRERRKKRRQQVAQQRDQLNEAEERKDSPSYKLQLIQDEEREKYEEACRERERQIQHTLWLERERLALDAIAEKKRREELIQQKQAEEEKRIRAEWEERQRQIKEEYEEKQKKEQAKREKQSQRYGRMNGQFLIADALLKEAQSGRKGKDEGAWHNPLAPANYGPEAEVCPFFAKTGACRFGDQCSRAHPMPESSCTLLFRGMYAHFGLMEGLQEEFDLVKPLLPPRWWRHLSVCQEPQEKRSRDLAEAVSADPDLRGGRRSIPQLFQLGNFTLRSFHMVAPHGIHKQCIKHTEQVSALTASARSSDCFSYGILDSLQASPHLSRNMIKHHVTDITLEYEDRETYQHFRDFYEDVVPEFKAFGRVIQFKVCCNYEPHLRGNVYVQFRREEDAQEVFKRFNARWYAGRQLQCEFCGVVKWKQAICGQFRTKKCPKGKNCNFLHVFQNPGGEFWEADRDFEMQDRYDRRQNSERSYRPRAFHRNNWDWRGSVRRSRSRSPDRSRRQQRSSQSSRGSRSQSHERSVRRSRSRSPSRPSRRRSRSPIRKSTARSRSRSRSPRVWRSSRRDFKRRPMSKSPCRNKSMNNLCRSRSRSPSVATQASNRWNSDSDSDNECSIRNDTNGNSSRRSSRSPSQRGSRPSSQSPKIRERNQRSSSRSPSWSASKKHKHKKHKKAKKHKQRHKSKSPENSRSPEKTLKINGDSDQMNTKDNEKINKTSVRDAYLDVDNIN